MGSIDQRLTSLWGFGSKQLISLGDYGALPFLLERNAINHPKVRRSSLIDDLKSGENPKIAVSNYCSRVKSSIKQARRKYSREAFLGSKKLVETNDLEEILEVDSGISKTAIKKNLIKLGYLREQAKELVNENRKGAKYLLVYQICPQERLTYSRIKDMFDKNMFGKLRNAHRATCKMNHTDVFGRKLPQTEDITNRLIWLNYSSSDAKIIRAIDGVERLIQEGIGPLGMLFGSDITSFLRKGEFEEIFRIYIHERKKVYGIK